MRITTSRFGLIQTTKKIQISILRTWKNYIGNDDFFPFLILFHILSTGRNQDPEIATIIETLHEQIYLYSALCFGRNQISKDTIQTKITAKYLLKNIWNAGYPKSTKVHFTIYNSFC